MLSHWALLLMLNHFAVILFIFFLLVSVAMIPHIRENKITLDFWQILESLSYFSFTKALN